MDATDATTILGAAKVTGRTSEGNHGGSARRGHEQRDSDVPHARQHDRSRSRKSSRCRTTSSGGCERISAGGNTRIGTIGTLVNRSLEQRRRDRAAADRARSVRRSTSTTTGAIATYAFNVQTALTDIEGDTAAIRRAQQSSARYYQRPGRDETSDGLFDIDYDPTRTSLNGYGFYARLAKDNGNWLWETTQNWRSPGFEANDMGVLGRADYKWMLANVARQWTTPGSWYRFVCASFGAQAAVQLRGRPHRRRVTTAGSTRRSRTTGTRECSRSYHPSYLDERLTRGGPTVKHYGYNFLGANLSGDQRKRSSGE